MVPGLSSQGIVKVVGDGSGVKVWFEPHLELVRPIRIFFCELTRYIVGDDDAAGRVEIAVQELVENAVKGSAGRQIAAELTLRGTPQSVVARLETTNRASGWNIACLRQAVKEVSAATSPQHLFLELMKRGRGTGLGIGRVRAEAEMAVGFEVHEDNVIVAAVTTFNKESK